MGTGRSMKVKNSLKVEHNPPLRGLCEGRGKRWSATVGEAPDSVRGLTSVQYTSRVIGKRGGGRLKVEGMDGQRVES